MPEPRRCNGPQRVEKGDRHLALSLLLRNFDPVAWSQSPFSKSSCLLVQKSRKPLHFGGDAGGE